MTFFYIAMGNLTSIGGYDLSMYPGDHEPSHIHILQNGKLKARIAFEIEEIKGNIKLKRYWLLPRKKGKIDTLPPDKLKIILSWIETHIKELNDSWKSTSSGELPTRISNSLKSKKSFFLGLELTCMKMN
jgi:hypothetical protein